MSTNKFDSFECLKSQPIALSYCLKLLFNVFETGERFPSTDFFGLQNCNIRDIALHLRFGNIVSFL